MRPVIVTDRDDDRDIPPPRGGPRFGLGFLVLLLLALLIGGRSIASFVIEMEWWKEVGQLETFYSQLSYSFLPGAASFVFLFVVLWFCHAAGMHSGGTSMRSHRSYTRVSALLTAGVSLVLTLLLVDSGAIVRYAGGHGSAGTYRDPVFSEPLSFYLFDLPLLNMMLTYLIGASIACVLVFVIAARGWSLRERLRQGGQIDIEDIDAGDLLGSRLILSAGALALLGLAGRLYLNRYTLLNEDHGFMVGVDYVAETLLLPMAWAAVGLTVLAAVLLMMRMWKLAIGLVAIALVAPGLVGRAVNWAYVKPNEISIQRPYIARHIAATRAAYGLDPHLRETEFSTARAAGGPASVDLRKQSAILENVRLWDWQAFHDTVTQIQALRPYYVFKDSDVDRYRLPDATGQLRMRQVLLTPRELDVRQLPDARTRWINPHFIYTHGYGVVMSEANRITADGLPYLFIQNAPPEIRTPGLKLTRPEIYFGEAVHEPVFVRTGQEEFNYPSGSGNVHAKYEGTGGIPVASFPMKLAAALREGDWNILLTSLLTDDSRMMIRRRVLDRLEAVADFVRWDEDPYLVVTPEGRLVWLVDGYTTSNKHPYSRSVRTQYGTVNYMRNPVKAAVDAYDGSIRLYVFDETDPILAAYRSLFPRLFLSASAMPAALREHTRYAETIFRVQAEMYRTFHMKDPEAFYNKEDLWDIARNTSSQEGEATTATPTYLVASLPGSAQPEFVLMIPFTPRNKDNLIGLMVARCDGQHLGEMQVLLLSKQELVFGPMQIKARINQDQNISKDLTLWNQQGSKVIRGQMLVLPVDNTFLYVEPIYLQASQAPMPQLKKIALAMGNQIAYADTYEQALAQLNASFSSQQPQTTAPAATPQPTASAAPAEDRRIGEARARLRRYRELMAEGKFAEAGRELEALQQMLR